MTIPVVLMGFANDPGNHLAMLTRERKAVCSALSAYEDQRFIRVQAEPSAGLDDLFGLFNRFAGQIAIFHYGGHADGTALQLETPGGKELAHAAGLAQLMGQSAGLKLVFLNGCATRDQVKALLANGVPAVIATAVPIDDSMATEFAEQFYQSLASRKTIKEAFDAASALIASRYGETRAIGEFRGIEFGDGEADAPAPPELTWGLYTHPDHADVKQWQLPQQAENQVIVRGAALSHATTVAVNEGLIQTLFNAISPFSAEVGVLFEMAKRLGRSDLRTVRQQIIDAYPAPLGEQLRKLFSSNNVDEARLRQLVTTYDIGTRMFAFILLSQLWNARFEKHDLVTTPEQRAALLEFLELQPDSEPNFDYLQLITIIDGILSANTVEPFMELGAGLNASLAVDASNDAHRFMTEMRGELAKGAVNAAEIESFCVQAERHLGTILTDFAFIVSYKLATIKGIAITKTRHRPPEFKHRQVLLDRVTAGYIDSDEVRADFTDNESVILLKDLEDVSQYLNLTPFIIDQNALTGNENTKLFFLRGYSPADRTCHYYSIADPSDVLLISDTMDPKDQAAHLPVRSLVEEFREAVQAP
ncbi:CHAT domain-containing protein [Allopontixanthobacter sediminis]|uniref:CHAT domain-containing protein n=1 Tax=Allopontixanthobacter sediminis TaxID=1689985 RepID=A0A845B103_9SPHN|nr:CHAT domain-containing protein [Allopontixanthobacter sediminis]MXP43097.1 CHAT domain-containing protein [Allopontixanthobacter sediminis]